MRGGISWSRKQRLGTNLTEANMLSANLRRADLNEAILTRANLQQADLSGADLSGANMEGVEGITEKELEEQAGSLEDATMPDGTGRD
ncbi:MAG TPA: pentapeptide repeat-containing protein [Rubrobacteraceae bacterium]|nr:pentapeptide repeat-containing protein [Rubrobacteraceae bacterium]